MEIIKTIRDEGPKGVFISEEEKVSTISKLITIKKVNVNGEDEKGNTALYHACAEGYPKIVEFLLKNGADANKFKDYNEITPLMAANWSCYGEENKIKIKELLLPYCTINTINFAGHDGRTALSETCHHYALSDIRDKEETAIKLDTIKLLLKNGAKVDRKSLREQKLAATKDLQIAKNLSKYLDLAKAYDEAPDQVKFLEERKPKDNATEQEKDDYNLLIQRSFVIKPIKNNKVPVMFNEEDFWSKLNKSN
jgi:Ankyrin repeat.